jgi:hypothetical protein
LEAKLNDEPLHSDAAVLAALAAASCRPRRDLDSKRGVTAAVCAKRHERSLRELPKPFKQPFWKQVSELHKARCGVDYRTLDFAVMLLRYHKLHFEI